MKSLRMRLFAFTGMVVLFFAGFIMLLDLLFLNQYYLWTTQRLLKSKAKEITELITDDLNFTTDVFNDIERSNNIDIIIYTSDGQICYFTELNNFDATTQGHQDFERIVRNATQTEIVSYETISETARFEIQRDPDGNIEYLALRTHLKDDYWGVVKVVKTSLENAASTASSFVWPVCITTLFFVLIACFIFARQFAKPITEMNTIARNMSHFDFSQKVQVKSNDEIGQLAESVNILSNNTSMLLEDLRNKNEQLEKDIAKERAVEKMRKEFISNVSHELKTPIAIIQGYAEGLRLNVAGDEERRKMYCDIIESESYKMDRLVRQLLELSQIEAGQTVIKKEVFELTAMLSSVTERIKSITDETTIELICDDTERMAYADEMRIGQVVTNFVNNAVSHAKYEKKVQIAITEGRDVYRVSVFNTGDNISDENIEHIWESFYRADKARSRENGNYGLGLSIVRGIMNMHGQQYGVVNVEGGVVFWFDIEKAKEDLKEAEEQNL